MDFNIFSKNKKTKEDYSFSDWVGGGIMNCENCASKQDASRGSVCISCNHENDNEKRRMHEVLEKRKLKNDERIRVEKENLSAKEEIIEIAKMRIQKDDEIRNGNWKKEIDKEKRELAVEKKNFKKISNEKIQELIKIPEVIEKAKMQIHEEKRLEKLAEEEKNKSIKSEFIEILNFIETDFFIDGKIHDEDALEAQLRQVLKTQFKNKHDFERQEIIAGGANRLDLLIDKKFVIELKIPESPSSLRNLYGQLRDYWEEYGDNICVFILKQDAFDSKIIDLWVKRYKDDFGIESIVKHGNKKKPNVGGMNSKLSD